MMNVALLGGGGHSRGNHLPALVRYCELNPGRIALSAFCDLSPSTAKQVASEFGFARFYTDLGEMLSAERIDALIAVTPVHITARVAATVLRAGIPLLMEKPPGATPAEVAEVCRLVETLGSRVMVSMNRRFDPALSAARQWLGDRPLRYVRASMLRDKRTESGYITDTAIHGMDAVRSIAGDVRSYHVRTREVDGVRWYWIDLEFESGAAGLLEIVPTCGCLAESYDLFGPNCRVTARIAEFDSGTLTAWEDARIVLNTNPTEQLPGYVRNGTYAETETFLNAVQNGLPLGPTPSDVRQSVEICHAIRAEIDRQSVSPRSSSIGGD